MLSISISHLQKQQSPPQNHGDNFREAQCGRWHAEGPQRTPLKVTFKVVSSSEWVSNCRGQAHGAPWGEPGRGQSTTGGERPPGLWFCTPVLEQYRCSLGNPSIAEALPSPHSCSPPSLPSRKGRPQAPCPHVSV